MSEILSQAEIEALLAELQTSGGEESVGDSAPAGVGASGQGTPGDFAAAPNSKRTIAYEVYDFRRPDKFAKDQLRTLQMLHETFGRLATSSLSAYLRSPAQVEMISLEQVPYEEYLLSINKSVFAIISLAPLNGQAVFELEFSLVFTILDRLLGGTGRGFDRSTLTDIERPLVTQVLERFFGALKSAWESIIMISPGVEGIETSSQFVQVAPPNDIVITILFEVRVGSQRGAMSLCIPYQVLKPVTAKLSATKWFSSGPKRTSPAMKSLLSWHVQRVPVPCAVQLGTTRLHVRDFLSLRHGDILKLDQETGSEMLLTVDRIPKFHGRPAIAGRKVIFNIHDRVRD